MKRIFIILFFFTLSASFIQLDANENAERESIMQILNRQPESIRLEYLNNLAQNHIIENRSILYANMLFSEASHNNNKKYIGNACFFFCAYYFNIDNDSMRYYMRKAEPIFLSDGRYEYLFRIKCWNLYILGSEGKSEAVLPEVNKMKQLAKKVNYLEGSIMADQGLANFYFITGLKAEGLKLFEESYYKLIKIKAPIRLVIYPLQQLIYRNENIQKRRFYLNILNSYIHKFEVEKITRVDEILSVTVLKLTFYKYSSLTEYLASNANRMLYYNELAKRYAKENKLNDQDYAFNYLDFFYYYLINNNEKALQISNYLLDTALEKNRMEDYLCVLKTRNNILKRMGSYEESLRGYRKYMYIKDSIHSRTIYKELATLHDQHEINNLQVKNQQMELRASQNRLQVITLVTVIVLLIMICSILIYMSWSGRKRALRSRKAEIKAIEADKMKSAFLANMNHEIRTPLNAIVGFSELITNEEDLETRKKYADIIMSNNEQLEQLIGEALDISKIESNSIDLTYSEIELNSIMKNIYNSSKVRIGEDVELILDDCEDITFYTDRVRLIQIMNNLLNNAIKHTRKGHILFGYTREENQIRFYVEDTGEGIPENQLNTIFVRFTQLNDPNKSVSGVGLGLTICKGILKQMGGSITVKSEVGKGSTFSFILPLIHQKTEEKVGNE